MKKMKKEKRSCITFLNKSILRCPDILKENTQFFFVHSLSGELKKEHMAMVLYAGDK